MKFHIIGEFSAYIWEKIPRVKSLRDYEVELRREKHGL
jgi:hypothetical protein